MNGDGTRNGFVDQDYRYRYDSLNRVVVSKGQLINGIVRRGIGGTDILYDVAGQRRITVTDRMDGNVR